MKPFVFKQFSLAQNKTVFRVGTDGVLLGALANCAEASSALEIGTGSGIISLMLAQRNRNLKILAIDIEKNAAELAAVNFQNSPFAKRLTARHIDFKSFSTDEKFDLIFSNPPYFEVQDSAKDRIARQKIELNFEDLIENSARLLAPEGLFSVIIPAIEAEKFVSKGEERNLVLNRQVNIKGIENGPTKRCVLEFSFFEKDLVEENLVLESSPRVYSEQYRKLTNDFHPHF